MYRLSRFPQEGGFYLVVVRINTDKFANCLKTNQELAFQEKISPRSVLAMHMKSYMDETVVLVLSLHHQKVISETRILYEKKQT